MKYVGTKCFTSKCYHLLAGGNRKDMPVFDLLSFFEILLTITNGPPIFQSTCIVLVTRMHTYSLCTNLTNSPKTIATTAWDVRSSTTRKPLRFLFAFLIAVVIVALATGRIQRSAAVLVRTVHHFLVRIIDHRESWIVFGYGGFCSGCTEELVQQNRRRIQIILTVQWPSVGRIHVRHRVKIKV